MAKKRRLLWQLYPTYLLVTILTVAAATWFASKTLKQFYHQQNALDLEARARLFEAQVSEYLEPLDGKSIDQLCKKIGRNGITRLTVILPDGTVVGDSSKDPSVMDNHADRPEVLQALDGEMGVSTRFSRTLQDDMMYVGVPMKHDSQVVGIVRTSVSLSPIDSTLKDIEGRIVLSGILIAMFAAILSLIVSHRITRPIEEIKKGAEGFARGDFETRVPVFNSEELGSLSETMNNMAVELRERINTMKRQRNELEAILSSMAEGVIAVNNEENIISVNQAAAQMLRGNPSDMRNRSIQEVVRNTNLHNFVKKTLSSEKAVEKDIILHGESDYILKGYGTVLHDAEGESMGALIVLNNVTPLRRLEKIRSDFVANVSHEIKTPITAIKGFVETLRDGAMENREDAERFLKIIENHVDRLSDIIEDLLSLSRIEKEVEIDDIELEESGIMDILLTAIQVCQVKADSKNVDIMLACDKDLKAEVNVPLLEQAVINLLDNAIKYSEPETTVHIGAIKTESEIVLNVKDQGCGIGKEHLPRLFERFYRVDRARSRKAGGTGLGLSIVKHIAQAHKGRIEVESIPGKGSRFSLHLPTF